MSTTDSIFAAVFLFTGLCCVEHGMRLWSETALWIYRGVVLVAIGMLIVCGVLPW